MVFACPTWQSCVLQAVHGKGKRIGKSWRPDKRARASARKPFAEVLEFDAVGFGRGDQRLELGLGRDYSTEVFGVEQSLFDEPLTEKERATRP